MMRYMNLAVNSIAAAIAFLVSSLLISVPVGMLLPDHLVWLFTLPFGMLFGLIAAVLISTMA